MFEYTQMLVSIRKNTHTHNELFRWKTEGFFYATSKYTAMGLLLLMMIFESYTQFWSIVFEICGYHRFVHTHWGKIK